MRKLVLLAVLLRALPLQAGPSVHARTAPQLVRLAGWFETGTGAKVASLAGNPALSNSPFVAERTGPLEVQAHFFPSGERLKVETLALRVKELGVTAVPQAETPTQPLSQTLESLRAVLASVSAEELRTMPLAELDAYARRLMDGVASRQGAPEETAVRVDPYSREYLAGLFDGLEAASYERTSNIISLGLGERFRKRGVSLLALKEGEVVGDLMSGTGEAWPYLMPKLGSAGKVVAIDFSPQMTLSARRRRAEHFAGRDIEVLERDATTTGLESGSLDAVFSGYGVKTLSPELRLAFAKEIARLLKPGGRFSLVEASVPKNRFMRAVQSFYMGRVVPLLMKLLPGNHDLFLMINKYLADFKNADALVEDLRKQGLDARAVPLFGGVATVVVGSK